MSFENNGTDGNSLEERIDVQYYLSDTDIEEIEEDDFSDEDEIEEDN